MTLLIDLCGSVEMDNDDILNVISEFLSVSDMVCLGCTCRRLKSKIEVIVGDRMSQLRKRVDANVKILNDQSHQLSRDKYSNYQAFWNAHMDEKRARINLRIENLQCDVYTAAATLSGHHLNSCFFEIAKTSQGGRVLLSGLHLAAAFGDVSLCRLCLDRGADINPNIIITNSANRFDNTDRCHENIQNGSGNNREMNLEVITNYESTVYRWGFVTPMRLATTFGNVNTAKFLYLAMSSGGDDDTAINVDGEKVFASSKLPTLPNIDRSLWTSKDEREIFYMATTKLDMNSQGDESETGNYSGPLFRHDLKATLASLIVT